MKTWRCSVCGFEYKEELGLPEEGIEAGTPWDDVDEDWECPDCGASKGEFDLVD